MVRSKRKWKKDSPEKLAQRIENQLVRLRKMPQKEITSPESKKPKSIDELNTESSYDSLIDISKVPNTPLTINEKGPAPQQPTPSENETDGEKENEKEITTQYNTEDTEVEAETTKPHIENALSAITNSLQSLSQTVANISANMVSKNDIEQIRNIIQVQDDQIAENTDKIKKSMTKEDGKRLERKIKDHDSILKTQADEMEKIEQGINQGEKNMKIMQETVEKTGGRIDGLVEATRKQNSNILHEIEDMRQQIHAQNAEIQSLKNGQQVNIHPLPQQPIDNAQPQTQDTRLNVVIEGLNESESEDLEEKIGNLCSKMGVNLMPGDISSAWRLKRRIPLKGKPNPVKIAFSNYSPKEKIMNSKYKLKKNPGTEHVWINHDEPTALRRAKGRARFIASYSRRKGSQVQLTHSGIIIDDAYYSYEKLDTVPSIYIPPKTLQIPTNPPPPNTGGNNNTNDRPNVIEPMEQSIPIPLDHDHMRSNPAVPLRPVPAEEIEPLPINANHPRSPKTPRTKKPQKMRLTKSGLVYSGPSAIFSHLYKAPFTIDDTPYNSVEQKLQYEKSMMAKDLQAAESIMNSTSTWEIKQIGDRVKVTKEYIENRLHIARIGNEAKFRDNPDLMEALIETGDVKLIEGATSSFWAGGEHYDSEAYENEDAHGKNYQGNMVMNLRANEIRRRSRQAKQ